MTYANQQPRHQPERDFENALRPLSFEDFSGQDKVVDNLRIFVKAARLRGEALDHVLLHGPPGLGKTTLSNIIANELGVGFKITSGPVLDKPGDLAGVLTSLEPNDVLFIDEIHRLSARSGGISVYSAMEDYRIDIMIDKGPSARSIQIDLNPFTLVGATTRSGLLTAPLRARFGINLHLEYYDDDVLSGIIRRSSGILDVPCSVRCCRRDCEPQPWHAAYCQCIAAACTRFCPSERFGEYRYGNRTVCPRSPEYRQIRSG